MSRLFLPCLAAGLAASGALAGGVERSVTPLGLLFEPGNYAELSFTAAQPRISGEETVDPLSPFGLAGDPSGDMTIGYGTVGFAYKTQLTPELSGALIYGQPYGADVGYPAGTGYYAQGARAELETHALTGVLRYAFPSNFSVYGGIRYQTLKAFADLPYVTGGYTADGERDGAWGYLVGVAYERPDIALRVGLTYASKMKHELDTTEVGPAIPGGVFESVTEITTPQSVTLDFQTGIAADTLLFGSVRWAEWTEFVISPAFYDALPFDPLVEYEDDRVTYNLGIGRQLNETWAVAGLVGYEPSTGSVAGNLGPTDGYTSLGVAATYTRDKVEVTGGLAYYWVGDAETPQGSEFEGNDAVAAALRVGFAF